MSGGHTSPRDLGGGARKPWGVGQNRGILNDADEATTRKGKIQKTSGTPTPGLAAVSCPEKDS